MITEIDRIAKIAENYGKVWNPDKILEAMKRQYELLGIPLPKVVFVENWQEGFSKARGAAWGAARDAAWDAAWGAARDAAWDAAWGAAWDAAWDAAWGAALYCATINTGLTNPATLKLKEIQLEIFKALENGLGIYFPMKDCLILCPVPVFRFNNNLLHSDTRPAIEWKNLGFHYLNGVKFPEDLWLKVTSGKMPFQDILAIVDIDQRTQAMKYGNVRDFLKHAKGELLESYQKSDINGDTVNYELYKIPQGEIFREDAYYVVYDCPSTRKIYMSGVEECKTVAEAFAWKFYMTPEQWKLMVPLEHES